MRTSIHKLAKLRIPAHLTAIPGTLDRDSGLLGPGAEALLSPGFAVLFLPWLNTGLAIGQPAASVSEPWSPRNAVSGAAANSSSSMAPRVPSVLVDAMAPKAPVPPLTTPSRSDERRTPSAEGS